MLELPRRRVDPREGRAPEAQGAVLGGLQRQLRDAPAAPVLRGQEGAQQRRGKRLLDVRRERDPHGPIERVHALDWVLGLERLQRLVKVP